MRQAIVLYKNKEAGILTQKDDGSFVYKYHELWHNDSSKPGISLSLPKLKQEYFSEHMFPFFFNMLPEGTNKEMVCKYHKIDLKDYFSLLMITAKRDNIGAVSIIKILTE